MLQAVILWQVYAISGSTLSLGIVGLVGFVSTLLSSLIGGVVVDAYDRRMVLFTVAFVWNRKELLGAMTLDMFAVLFGGAKALLPVYAIDVLHANAVGYGILSASLEA